MINEVIILYGTSGAGKTTYSKILEKQGYTIVELDRTIDFRIDYSNKLLVLNVLNDLKKRIEDYTHICLVGYIPECDIYFKWFREHICENIKVKILFAPVYIIQHRRAGPDCYHYSIGGESSIKENYLLMLKQIGDIDTEYIDTTGEYKFMRFNNILEFSSYWDKINRKYTAAEIGEFFKRIPIINPEYAYMDIELHPYYQIGYVHSYYSWIRIKNMVKFTMQSVVDIGCNQGYFCFKSHEANAKCVIGVDYDNRVLEVARKIRDIKQYPVSFMKSYVEDAILPMRNITLCMNVLHHFKDKEKGLFNVFNNSDKVIFECNVEEKEIIMEMAKGFGKTLKITMGSHREGITKENKRRMIMLYE